jgi:hypothetical protein
LVVYFGRILVSDSVHLDNETSFFHGNELDPRQVGGELEVGRVEDEGRVPGAGGVEGDTVVVRLVAKLASWCHFEGICEKSTSSADASL